MKTYFDHEKLDVYQEAIAFCGWIGELLSQISAKAAAKDHLDRASTSLPLNIAQGNGKFSTVDRARFLEIARGSALECAARLDMPADHQLPSRTRCENRFSVALRPTEGKASGKIFASPNRRVFVFADPSSRHFQPRHHW